MFFFHKKYRETLDQKIVDNCNKINCSFEFFPPKNIIFEKKLWSSATHLSKLKPSFFSITFGANNGEREKTYNTVQEVYKRTGIMSAPHLTCVDFSQSELHSIAEKYWNNGIKSIVALRGDVLKKNYKHEMYAVDLVCLLKKVANFDISVAAYPELHPESPNAHADIINLKRKIDAGANRAITQFFFNIDSYLRFRDRCIKHNILVDIIPGILPISNFKQLLKFSSLTNVNIPKWIHLLFKGLENDLNTQKILGSMIATDIVKKLYDEGVKNFHFYTLNHSKVIYAICHLLGL